MRLPSVNLPEGKSTNEDAVGNDLVNPERPENNRAPSDDHQEHSPILLRVLEPINNHDSLLFEPAEGLASPAGRQVHGYCRLPVGYALSIVPNSAMVRPLIDLMSSQTDTRRDPGKVRVRRRSNGSLARPSFLGEREVSSVDFSSYYSLSKSLVAILQLTYATYTLVQTKGDQIDRFGYAAFGLTVAPYLIVSFINLL